MLKLEKLNFLDTKGGLYYCGYYEEIYLEIVKEFETSAKDKLLQELYEDKNWEEYHIRVHGLKGSALTIGATELSEEAGKMERAVKERNLLYIEEKHFLLIEKYRGVLQNIRNAIVAE